MSFGSAKTPPRNITDGSKLPISGTESVFLRLNMQTLTTTHWIYSSLLSVNCRPPTNGRQPSSDQHLSTSGTGH